jgi:hypothetical protein
MAEVGSRRILRVMEAFAAQPPGPPELRLCSAASKLLDAAGVGVSFGASDDLLDSGLQTVCATDGGRDGEALQAELGEGPSHTAHRTGQPVQVPDLELDHTWPAFATAAAPLGLRAVFAWVSVPCSRSRCGPVRSGSGR